MKKIFTFAFSALLGLTAAAQGVYQFADPSFEDWDADNEPGKGWTSFASADASALGGFIGNIAKNNSPKPEKVEGHTGTTAVKLFSKPVANIPANGNLTTGQIHMGSTKPADASNYNSTKVGDAAHSLVFAGTPDAVGFYAKFKSGGSANGRGNFILHDECEYKDPEVADQTAHRVGIATALIPAADAWTYFEAPFVYDRAEKPATQYLLASFTTNPVPGGSAGDELIIDDVYFVYYSTLSALAYDGADIAFNEATTSYDLSSQIYTPSKLSYTAKGAGATVETAYDETEGLLTITVKGNDFSVNAQNVTVYRLQFSTNSTPVEPEALGEKLLSLDEAALTKTYVLYNEHFTAYATYNATGSTENVWAAGMTGDDGHALSNETYGNPLDVTAAGSSWMLVPKDGKYYLYNMGAKKFLVTPGHLGTTGGCSFSDEPVALTAEVLGDGNFAFTASDDEKDYMCAAPQLATPVSTWTSEDAGSAWQLMENPNVAADPIIAALAAKALGEKLLSLDEVANDKTYVLYNEHFTAYAVHDGSTNNIWVAGMTGIDDGEHGLANEAYGNPLDVTSAGSSWMVIPKEGGFCLYNMGAGKYLTTPGYDGKTGACTFSDEPVLLAAVSLGDGNFAFTASGEENDYMCASPQFSTPVSIWKSSDAGAAWQLKENPNVAADPDVYHAVTGIGIGAVQTAQPRTGVYTIGGVRLENTANLPKGIYIVNGKKTVVGR